VASLRAAGKVAQARGGELSPARNLLWFCSPHHAQDGVIELGFGGAPAAEGWCRVEARSEVALG